MFIKKRTFILGLLTAFIAFGFIFATANAITTKAQKEKVRSASTNDTSFIPLQVGIPVPGCSTITELVCDGNLAIGVSDASGLIVAFFRFGIIFMSILLTGLLAIGGIIWMSSGGDTGRIKKGRDYIKNAFMSLIVLMFSVVILYQINPKLIDLSTAKPAKIESKLIAAECPGLENIKCGKRFNPADTKGTAGQSQCTGKKCDNKAKYCPKTDGLYSGSCTTKKADGKKCDYPEECRSGNCYNSDTSDPEFECTPSKAGEECTLKKDCEGLICEHNNVATCSYGLTGNDCVSNSECRDDLGYKCITSGRNFCNKTTQIFSKCEDTEECIRGSMCDEPYELTSLKPFTTNDLDKLTGYDPDFTDLDIDISVCAPTVREEENTDDVILPVFTCSSNESCQNQLNALLSLENDCPKKGKGSQSCIDIINTYKALKNSYNTMICAGVLAPGGFCSFGAIGSPCTNGNDCANDLKCNTFGQNVCSEGKVGDTCDDNNECANGLTCNTDTHFCAL